MTGEKQKCISVDPPWLERGCGKCKRGADKHYPLMTKEQIVYEIAASKEFNPDWEGGCHLWLWATSNHLSDALWVIENLRSGGHKGQRFKLKTTAVWVKMRNDKLQIGLGQYMRHSHELLLLATTGKAMVPTPENRPPSVIFAERTKHSKKPKEAFDLIEKVSPGPRLEMFARGPRDGWAVHGHEKNQGE